MSAEFRSESLTCPHSRTRSAPLTGFNWPRPLPRPQTIPTRRLLNIERRSDSNQGSHYLEFSTLPTELPGRTKLLRDGATHQKRPHANRTYGSGVIGFFIMLLASVLMVFMASVNRALMSLLTSCWKPSITWKKTLFLMIPSTNSTRAAATKSLFRASSLKASVLVARKMSSGRA